MGRLQISGVHGYLTFEDAKRILPSDMSDAQIHRVIAVYDRVTQATQHSFERYCEDIIASKLDDDVEGRVYYRAGYEAVGEIFDEAFPTEE